MEKIACLLVRPDKLREVEGAYRKVVGKAGIRGSRLPGSIQRRRKSRVRFAVLVHLLGGFTGIRYAVCAWKGAVKCVEAPILLINNDDVLNVA